MYAKCGCLDVAVSIFNKMPFKKVSWNAMINGLHCMAMVGKLLSALTV